jgi:hypothetical protein
MATVQGRLRTSFSTESTIDISSAAGDLGSNPVSVRQDVPTVFVHNPRVFNRRSFDMKAIATVVVSALMLAASLAQAVELTVDPGTAGDPVTSPLNFTTFPVSPLIVDLVFADSKTLTWGPGTLAFALTGTPSGGASFLSGYFFSDDPNTALPGTDFAGSIEGGVITVNLPAETVWKGMHFEAIFQDNIAYSLIWTDRPTVGVDTTPVEAGSWGRIKSLYSGE